MRSGWDPATFAALYERHTPKLYGLALRLAGGAEADAEDLVHQCWLRAAIARRPFAGRSTFSSWLCGILVNIYRESLRKRWSGQEEEPAIETPSPVWGLDLERILGRMQPQWREVVVLHDLYGYTHDEIARALDLSEGTSKSRLSRARAWLRQQCQSSRRHHETG